MKPIEEIKYYADLLRLTELRNNPESIIHEAQLNNYTHLEFLHKALEVEVKLRKGRDLQRRIKLARLPTKHDLDQYDHTVPNGMTKSQLAQLKELIWLDQNYNIIMMGPSGIGKTYIAAGLVHHAVKRGYRAYFVTMNELITTIKMRDITSTAMNTYNRFLRSHLIAIDDIMMFPMKKQEAVEFFNLINQLHEKVSVIITTNKSPKEWVDVLEDEVLATALLDRLLYRCEVISLDGNSYRLENRKTIF